MFHIRQMKNVRACVCLCVCADGSKSVHVQCTKFASIGKLIQYHLEILC